MCVWLRRSVYRALLRAADEKAPLETGGVLMGYQDGRSTLVAAWIDAGPKATHTKTSFVPDYEYQERGIARVYEESGRLFTYLGDWHTHPDGGLQLSRTDRSTLGRIANHPPARVKRPVMLILAGGDPWQGGAWLWAPAWMRRYGKAAPVPIRLCE